MKTGILLCFLLTCINYSFSQSTTNAKTVTGGSNPLHKPNTILGQPQADLDSSSAIAYKLNLPVADLSAITTGTNGELNTCLFIDSNNKTYIGILTGDASSSLSLKSYTCTFSKNDINTIVAQKIVQIKITDASGNATLFSTDSNLQNSIVQQCKDLLNQ